MTLTPEIITALSSIGVAAIYGMFKLTNRWVGAVLDQKVEHRERVYEAQRALALEEYKLEIRNQGSAKNQAIAIIIGYMWDALHALKCDRVTIIQPHPLGDKPLYLTITLEVMKTGVSETAPSVKARPIEKMAKFASRLATEEFFIIDDIMNEPMDKTVKVAMQLAGTKSIAVHRLKSSDKYWIGNLIADHTIRACNDCGKCEKVMEELAKKIQIILPDYEG